jgi:hypothetical protein
VAVELMGIGMDTDIRWGREVAKRWKYRKAVHSDSENTRTLSNLCTSVGKDYGVSSSQQRRRDKCVTETVFGDVILRVGVKYSIDLTRELCRRTGRTTMVEVAERVAVITSDDNNSVFELRS